MKEVEVVAAEAARDRHAHTQREAGRRTVSGERGGGKVEAV